MTLPLTPSQTVGPFFAIGIGPTIGTHVVAEGSPGAVRISGQVLDGDGQPVRDALVETWQPEGVARSATDDEGQFAVVAIKPSGATTGAPHIDVSVFARGLLTRLVTRLYFPGEVANETDLVLQSLTPEERTTLVAAADGAGLRFDIHLQGTRETVFFDR
ncbi:MAG TPA: protocatechuate 3,4-dioxygenase subunit alpha [Candidatus Dormibacteraeota bacterium]